MHVNQEQWNKMARGQGFVAALDQSGGSTPRALEAYGIAPSSYEGDAQMFDLVHAMRSRIVTSPAFDGERILGAILFEDTMDREFDGEDAAAYLWQRKQVVPFLKVDKGLEAESGAVQMMKPIPRLASLLERARDKGIFGTKMRSVIHGANEQGIAAIVRQQFEVAAQILAAGLMPIIEPEVSITAPDKKEAEALLKTKLLEHLDALDTAHRVMLKLTLPSIDNDYAELVAHPRVLRLVVLSGGYSREQANTLLARNRGVIASFSRALTEGLLVTQDDDEFNRVLDASIAGIYEASLT
ncbi:MAG: fructose bisphosphate aldolase [Ottowia sp.]|nr:fructose bisphosphate aldolase [Ottowia sp.]